ncbi:MAG: hypothetical protein J5I50_01210 [Chitinophagaceae bacterium]|nr:hypothetical protein [Chitinophagaceae bacterium]
MPEKERLDKDRQTDIHSEADHYVTFFSPNNEIEVYTNNLPHWRQEDVWYFVTFRLHDSLPKDFVEQIRIERNHWLATNGGIRKAIILNNSYKSITDCFQNE